MEGRVSVTRRALRGDPPLLRLAVIAGLSGHGSLVEIAADARVI
jgi:hypothetical protein